MKLILKHSGTHELDISTRQYIKPNDELYKVTPQPIIKQPGILSFQEWSKHYESELENITESIHEFLRNVDEDEHKIIAYNRDELTKKLMKVIYDNSWNVYKNHSFFK